MSAEKIDYGDCRYYERQFPEPDELVMVKVKSIEDTGAYVSLLEYNNMEGLILMSELSKRRFRSVNKLIRVGRLEVVMVLRVDPSKGYIDLSKRRVAAEDIITCEDRFSKSKKVHQTVRHVAKSHDMKVDEVNRKLIWPLYRSHGHAINALKALASNPDEPIFKDVDVSPAVLKTLLDDIKLRLSPQAQRLRARFDVRCYGYEGIDAVRTALLAGAAVSDKSVEMEIKLVAPPQYVIVTSCTTPDLAMERVKKALQNISDTIKNYKGGDFRQIGEISIMGADDPHQLDDVEDESEEDEEGEQGTDEEEEDEGMGMADSEPGTSSQFIDFGSNLNTNTLASTVES